MAAIGSLKSARAAAGRPEPAQRIDAELVGPASAPAQGRALARVSPIIPTDRNMARSSQPAAAFLAHLIATALGATQTRTRRRAVPELAGAMYTAAAVICAQPGLTIRRIV